MPTGPDDSTATTFVLLLLTLISAGCVSFSSPDDVVEATLTIDLNEPCPVDVVERCDPERWLLQDVTLQRGEPGAGDPYPSVGILVKNLDRDLLIRNVTITGFDISIQLSGETCKTCTVTVADSEFITSERQWDARDDTVQGRAPVDLEGCPMMPNEVGVKAWDAQVGNISIMNTSFLLNGGGHLCSEVPHVIHGGGVALQAGRAEQVFIEDVAVEYQRPGASSAFQLHAIDEVIVQGVAVDGTAGPISMVDVNATRIQDARIHCVVPELMPPDSEPLALGSAANGLTLMAADIVLGNVSVSGCMRAGVYVDPVHRDLHRLDVSALTTSDNEMGLYVAGSPPVSEEYLSAPAVSVRDSTFSHNRYSGLVLPQTPNATVTASRFFANGASWQEGRDRGLPIPLLGGVAIDSRGLATLRDNDFQDNEPFALVVDETWVVGLREVPMVPARLIDARENWWGAEDGPTVKKMDRPEDPGYGPGSGDAVSDGVLFTPHQQRPNSD